MSPAAFGWSKLQSILTPKPFTVERRADTSPEQSIFFVQSPDRFQNPPAIDGRARANFPQAGRIGLRDSVQNQMVLGRGERDGVRPCDSVSYSDGSGRGCGQAARGILPESPGIYYSGMYP